VTLTIIASKLHIPAILSKTETENSLFNKTCIMHYRVNRRELVLSRTFPCHSQYPVCLLRVKQIRLFLRTSECVVKAVLQVECFAKLDLVPNHIAVIRTALLIPLIELAFVFIYTLA